MSAIGIRTAAGVGLAVAAVVLSGCSHEPLHRVGGASGSSSAVSTSASAQAPAAPARTPATDEADIRKLIEAEHQANLTWDVNALVNASCAKYKDDFQKMLSKMIQPMSAMGTPAEAANPPAGLVQAMLRKHPGLTPATAQAMVDAWHNQDEKAWDAAYLDSMREITRVTEWKLDNLKLNGDTASMDLTTVTAFDGHPPQTQVFHGPLVYEGGQWKDCSPPPAS